MSSSSSPFSANSSNPFLVSSSPFGEATVEAVQGEGTYAMIPAGPAVDASEVESNEFAVEVIVRWADNVLFTDHLSPARTFTIGEQDCDIVVPSESLGASRADLVRVIGSDVVACVPHGAKAIIKTADATLDLAAAQASGLASGNLIKLTNGMRVTIECGSLTLEVAGTHAGRVVAGKLEGETRPIGLFGFSLAVHGAIAAAMLAFMPALSATEEGQLNPDQTARLMATLAAVSERDEKPQENPNADESKLERQGGAGLASAGEAGKMGSQASSATNKRYSVSGGGQRMLSRQDAIKDAQDFGMAGMLASLQDSKNAPTAVWGNVAMGPDAQTFNGNLWGPEAGDAGGMGGLNLSGIGEGGGKSGWGVGLGNISTVGYGAGNCTDGNCQGFGNTSGHLPGTHKAKSPAGMRMAPPSVSGRLPPEVIQRIVRQGSGRFRACYEGALRTNPNLQGRVAVAFVIGRDGAVGSASNGGSDLADSAVVSCVVRSFYGMSFPAPEDGVVRVTYPIMFTPN